MTKAVRLPSATNWRCDRAVVAAAHQHVTPKASRPTTPSSLVGLSHNLLAQRTQRTAGPPMWRSASPRHARPAEAPRPPGAGPPGAGPPGAADDVDRPQRMAAAVDFAEAVDADFSRKEGDLSLPQASLQEAEGPEAAGSARTRRPRPSMHMPITPIEVGRDLDLDLGRDLDSALDTAPPPGGALVLNPSYVQAIARLASS